VRARRGPGAPALHARYGDRGSAERSDEDAWHRRDDEGAVERARIVPLRVRRDPETRRCDDGLQRLVRERAVQGRQAHLAMTSRGTGLEWLLAFSDPQRGVGWNSGSRGGLESNLRRTRILLDLAGAPDRRMRIVLIAGTKGKGSTAALLAGI